MNDACVRRYDLEITERALAPAKEGVALSIARELEPRVQRKRIRSPEVVDLHGVVDDELDGLERIDAVGVAAK